jgi:hypothetical protein
MAVMLGQFGAFMQGGDMQRHGMALALGQARGGGKNRCLAGGAGGADIGAQRAQAIQRAGGRYGGQIIQ